MEKMNTDNLKYSDMDYEMFGTPSVVQSIIMVIGVGGGGGNAVNYMSQKGITDVNFVVCNTDLQALDKSPVSIKVQIGKTLTAGLGAGNQPDVGRNSAIESENEIKDLLSGGTKMVFITAGMGGGTGTGAAPVIAKIAKDLGILTVGIVTIPFLFEGHARISQAIAGISEMEKYVDSLLVINNQRLQEMYGDLGISAFFSKADDVLATAAKGIAEVITLPGYINVDFADVVTVMRNSGVAVMGSAEGRGANRALDAIKEALNSPLLNSNNIRGAQNILLNLTSGKTNELKASELKIVTDYVKSIVGNSSTIIWGTVFDTSIDDSEEDKDKINITIVATGFPANSFIGKLNDQEPKVNVVTIDEDGEVMDDDVMVDEVDVDDEERARVVTFANDDKERVIDLLYSAASKPADAEDDEIAKLYGSEGAMVKSVTPEVALEDIYGDEDLMNDLENIPAYKRKKMGQSIVETKPQSPEPSNVSRFSISTKGKDGGASIGPNTFLHDNVD